ncbi:mtDNA inheritance, partitioning of the mitochondrial organelle [Acarospora aff. strigata]|nr:mtDNA inheritance, partitioning of the mitochondrial organelle [Acarospora aff. strigata]
MHEIITLQLGQRSNYVATHFWNTQESYFTYSDQEASLVDHDIHFRPGIGANGTETFTPRTLIYDLKGGFGSLRKINALYEVQEEQELPKGLWDGNVVVQKQSSIEQNEYLKSLEEGLPAPSLSTEMVRYWSDFNRVYYSPKSIVQLNDFDLNSRLMPFERWDVGEDLFGDLDREHDLLDRDLRPFAEECDQIQGLQVMTAVDDAWGGFAARYIDRIRDDFGKTSIWVWALEDGKNGQREKQLRRAVNVARSIQDVSTQASLYIPVLVPPQKCPSYVDLDQTSQWHTSAMVSVALESMTLPSRLRPLNGERCTLGQMEAALNTNGHQNIARLQYSVIDPETSQTRHESFGRVATRDYRVPATRQDTANTTEGLERDGMGLPIAGISAFDMDLLPEDHESSGSKVRKTHVFGQAESFRGVPEPSGPEKLEEDEGFTRKRRRISGLPMVEKYRTPLLFPLLDSFPRIFNGWSIQPESVAVHTSLSTTALVSNRVKKLRDIVNRTVGLDEREALSNGLGEICEAYEEGWESGSDSDDEDD